LCGEVGLELRRGHVAESGMKPFLVVDFVEEGADFAPRLGQIPVFVAVNLLIFQFS
jgi:hypothetical protein